jgi:HlyD family secretion protein
MGTPPDLAPTRANNMNAAPRLAALLALALAGCRPAPPDTSPGYVEGEFVHVAAPLAGTLTRLEVQRGTNVAPGQLLFALDPAPESSALLEATHRVTQARARHANLLKGRRPTELAALTAHVQRAEANLNLSRLDRDRREQLARDSVVADAELDLARARQQADAASVAALSMELETARLGAREDELAAATSEIAALEAALTRARWALDQKSQSAPTNGWVHDTLFRPGEWVPAGHPVVTLLPPGNLKVRFFVPQSRLASVRLGQSVTVFLDGLPAPFAATITYISPQAEFTPPVIYSRESRSKLVFLVEARPDPTLLDRLRPGQPVDVRFTPPSR